MEHWSDSHLSGRWCLRFWSGFKREHNWNCTRGGPGRRNFYRLQYDWRWNLDFNQARRPGHNHHNHSHKSFWQRAFSPSSYASGTADHFVFCSPILLFHHYPRGINGIQFTSNSARSVGFDCDVYSYFASRLSRLFIMLANSEKERHTFLVLKKSEYCKEM